MSAAGESSADAIQALAVACRAFLDSLPADRRAATRTPEIEAAAAQKSFLAWLRLRRTVAWATDLIHRRPPPDAEEYHPGLN